MYSWSAFTSKGVGLPEQMSSQFSGARLQLRVEHGSQTAQTTTGTLVTFNHITVPIAVSVRTPWGAAELPPITFFHCHTRHVQRGLVWHGNDEGLGVDLYPLHGWPLGRITGNFGTLLTMVRSADSVDD